MDLWPSRIKQVVDEINGDSMGHHGSFFLNRNNNTEQGRKEERKRKEKVLSGFCECARPKRFIDRAAEMSGCFAV